MDAYSWTISTDLQNVGLIPSFESLMSVEPCDDLSVIVVAIDKSRDPGLRELLNGIVSLSNSRITRKDLIDHLANIVCSRLGGQTWTEENLSSRWKECTQSLEDILHSVILPIGSLTVGLCVPEHCSLSIS
ncbi:serine/threonine-protein kinase CTR1-like [Neltuma alba]|uniref:serine/threonine-protein kinase CTR1-like n=1 Tax=Neltuma alba TaxID=207710 RepID=UPI0010A2DEF2|nr:serine/threonine-protein kinase CTR1-like [Prosopis alba]